MRYASVESTCLEVPRLRRRFGLLEASKWRLPARERMTFPVPVIGGLSFADQNDYLGIALTAGQQYFLLILIVLVLSSLFVIVADVVLVRLILTIYG